MPSYSFHVYIANQQGSVSLQTEQEGTRAIGDVIVELLCSQLDPLADLLAFPYFGNRLLHAAMTVEAIMAPVPEAERWLIVVLLPTSTGLQILQALQQEAKDRLDLPRFGKHFNEAPAFELKPAEETVDLDADVFEEDDFEEDDSGIIASPPVQPKTETALPMQKPKAPPPPSRVAIPVPGTARSRSEDTMLGGLGSMVMLPQVVSRRATVRFYDRMNPERVFPFMVALTEEQVQEIVQKHVTQIETGLIEMKVDEILEIEPILPGCTCYPHKAAFKLHSDDTMVRFWVVPHVLGKVQGAKVEIRQDGQVLGTIDLDIRVRKQTLAILASLFTLGMPFVSALAKRFGIDFDGGDFSVYMKILKVLFTEIPPSVLFSVLAVTSAGLYWWARPRSRDQFWDLETKKE